MPAPSIYWTDWDDRKGWQGTALQVRRAERPALGGNEGRQWASPCPTTVTVTGEGEAFRCGEMLRPYGGGQARAHMYNGGQALAHMYNGGRRAYTRTRARGAGAGI